MNHYRSGPFAWMAAAACRGMKPDFFPGRGEVTGAALAACLSCPVQPDCLAYAVARPGLEGWWGGASERTRRRIRQARRTAA
jgi:WhiB family redox-sensing transcriptional regulator